MQKAYTEVLRTDPSLNGAAFTTTLAEVESGKLPPAAAVSQVIKMARGTTSVATLSYQFFTHLTPDVTGIDYLVSPTGPNKNNLNSPYYQAMNQDGRYINFAVNLGKIGAGAAEFKASYGPLTIHEATAKAYAEIYGAQPTPEKVAAILDQVVSKNADGTPQTREQFLSMSGQDDPDAIGTKAAIVGWLLSQAASADVGDYALSNNAFLADIAKGSAKYGIDMVAKYNKPENHYKGG
jgi:serralysin